MVKLERLLATFLMLQTSVSAPFLDVFNHRNPAPALIEQVTSIETAGGRVAADLVMPATQGRWPAVLLVPGREGLTENMRQFAREIAGIGYVTLAIDDAGAGTLPLAISLLAAQPSVDSQRIGVVAWNDAFDAASKLPAAGTVTAVYPGRIASQRGMSEQTWVEIYEFLGTHVEDAGGAAASQADPPIARIVDIMRAIMSDQGTRGRLARQLSGPPAGDAQWDQARADAAIVAEAGSLLLAQRAPKGSTWG